MINHLSNTGSKAGDIIDIFKRVGAAAKQFGLTEIQTSASSYLLKLGKTSEVAGTGINAILTKLLTADKQGSKFQDVF